MKEKNRRKQDRIEAFSVVHSYDEKTIRTKRVWDKGIRFSREGRSVPTELAQHDFSVMNARGFQDGTWIEKKRWKRERETE